MTLRDLILKMSADERLLIISPVESEMLETTPEEIVNDFERLHDTNVEMIQRSTLYGALIIEVSNDNS